MAENVLLGRKLLQVLGEAGLLPPNCQRVVIDAAMSGAVQVYYECVGEPRLLVALPGALAQGAVQDIKNHDTDGMVWTKDGALVLNQHRQLTHSEKGWEWTKEVADSYEQWQELNTGQASPGIAVLGNVSARELNEAFKALDAAGLSTPQVHQKPIAGSLDQDSLEDIPEDEIDRPTIVG